MTKKRKKNDPQKSEIKQHKFWAQYIYSHLFCLVLSHFNTIKYLSKLLTVVSVF